MNKPDLGILELPFKFDPSEIVSYVNAFTDDEWSKWNLRQTLPNHQHTKSVKVLWIPLDVVNFNEGLVEKNEPVYSNVSIILKDCLDFLQTYYSGEIYKIIIVKLAPNSHIKPHTDHGFSLEVPHRVHLPIVTNSNVKFGCGQSEIHMAAGGMYEINNQQPHYVINDTEEHRIHIIIDVIENQLI